MAKKAAQMPALTSVRFFAAFYVVLYHTFSVLNMPVNGWVTRVFGLGYCSVSFFYTLSGFIMGAVYLTDNAEVDRRRYFIARFARIYPLFLATLLLDVPNLLIARVVKYGVLLAVTKTIATIVGTAFMLQVWWLNLRGLDNPNWSVAVEVMFYIMFPIIGPFIWRRTKKTAIAICSLLFVVELSIPLIGGSCGVPVDVLKFTPILHVHEFVVGIVTAKLYCINGSRETAVPESSPWPGLLSTVGIGILALAVILSGSIPQLLLHNGLLAPVYSAVIIGLASTKTALAKLFTNNSLILLGNASYALYLVHIPMWNYAMRLGMEHSRLAYGLYLIATVAASIVIYRYLEIPTRRIMVERLTRMNRTLAKAGFSTQSFPTAGQAPALSRGE
jgi:peptidoglycan/LPS O-acetylase OafA/YrhL